MKLWHLFLVAFVCLKLANVIAWSWVWVLSPLWIAFIVSVIVNVIIEILKRKDL